MKYLNLTVPVAELMGGKPPAQLSLWATTSIPWYDDESSAAERVLCILWNAVHRPELFSQEARGRQ
jgi:hypothetical protein